MCLHHDFHGVGDEFATGQAEPHAFVSHGDAVAYGDCVEFEGHSTRGDYAFLDCFAQFLQAARLRRPGLTTDRIEKALAAALAVDAGAAAAQAPAPAEIPACVDRAREQAIAASLAA